MRRLLGLDRETLAGDLDHREQPVGRRDAEPAAPAQPAPAVLFQCGRGLRRNACLHALTLLTRRLAPLTPSRLSPCARDAGGKSAGRPRLACPRPVVRYNAATLRTARPSDGPRPLPEPPETPMP